MTTKTFEEINRILQLVQKSKEKFQRIETHMTVLLMVAESILFLALAAGMYLGYHEVLESGIRHWIFAILSTFMVLISTCGLILYCNKIQRSSKQEYQQTSYQVAEFLSGYGPVADKSNWSALELVEFNLRVSILAINLKKQPKRGKRCVEKWV